MIGYGWGNVWYIVKFPEQWSAMDGGMIGYGWWNVSYIVKYPGEWSAMDGGMLDI